MRNVQTWVAVISALAIGAGAVAFLVSEPAASGGVAASELGFRTLVRDRLDVGAAYAADHHRELALVDASRSSAAAAAQGWLGALAQSRGRRVVPVAARAVTVGGGPAVAAFVRWADDLPRSTWRARVAAALPPDGLADGPDRTIRLEVTGHVTVTVAQAAQGSRVQRIPVTLTLSAPLPRGGTEPPARWTLLDVDVRARATYVRAYPDPVVLRGSGFDVVAPRTSLAEASTILPLFEAQVRGVRRRAGSVDGATTGTAWLVPARPRTEATLERAAPAIAWPDDPHAVAWMDERGELAIDLTAYADASDAERTAAVRHAATHVAVRSLDTYAPALLAEGVVVHLSSPGAGARTVRKPLRPQLLEVFGMGRTGIGRMLVASADQGLRDQAGPGEVQQRHELAALTVQWMLDARGDAALARLLASLERGDPPAAAVGRVFRLTPKQLERMVVRWARAGHLEATSRGSATTDGGG